MTYSVIRILSLQNNHKYFFFLSDQSYQLEESKGWLLYIWTTSTRILFWTLDGAGPNGAILHLQLRFREFC